MKLLITIVQDDDSKELLAHIAEAGYRATKLSSSGGFLRSGNTTLLIGIEDEKLDEVLQIIHDNCKSRTVIDSTPQFAPGGYGAFMHYEPMRINVGGATIFVLDVDKMIRF